MGMTMSNPTDINEHRRILDGVRGFLHRGLLGSHASWESTGLVRLVWRCVLEDKQKKISARLSSLETSTSFNALIVPEQAHPTNLLNVGITLIYTTGYWG